MAYHPPDYIDNTTDERKLVVVLSSLITLWEQHELDIASGFFEPKVWEMLAEPLSQLTAFRLLLGRPPELDHANGDDGTIDLRAFYRQRLRQDLERLPLERGYAQMVDELCRFLEGDHVQVRHYTGGAFLHGKAYLMPNVGIVGSSNFTPSGMTRKAELNLVQQHGAVVRELRDNWFETMWAQSDDQKQSLIDALNESKFGTTPWTPHDVFIKVLYEYFKDRLIDTADDVRLGVELASFQQEGFRESIRLIDRHRGVIVSDAVGLGKTYIGMSLLEHYIYGKRTKGHIPRGLVLCPAQLRDLVWEPKLDEYGIKADVLSHEMVSRADFQWKAYNHYDVVLVDESHNFRNPATNRYSNLTRMLATGNRHTIVILMTATPVNNSIWDLYNQVSLITRQSDTYFREYGIRNLRGYFRAVQEGSADIFSLLEQIMVRRSRTEVFDALDQATKDVLKEINAARRDRRLPPKLGKINRELLAPLQQASLMTTVSVVEDSVAPEALRERVTSVVQNVSLDVFRRDKTLKAIRQAYQEHQSQRLLAEALDEFFVDNEMYRDVPQPRSTLDQIKADDLRLIAWEILN